MGDMVQVMKTPSSPPREVTPKEQKDLKVLALFTSVFCRTHHGGEKEPLQWRSLGLPDPGKNQRFCSECRDFLLYAAARRLKCPLDPKPSCKHCHIHCYRPGHREKVREIMRYSGRHLIRRGRIDLLWHYFF